MQDFILEHYSDDGSKYDTEIKTFSGLRRAILRPQRDRMGIRRIAEYYNHLEYVEQRFFPPDRSLCIYFEWYDSLTGAPSMQKSISFEKASIMFNWAALHTQVGAKEERDNPAGLDQAVDAFGAAAGLLHYLRHNFAHPPSFDMQPETLDALIALMLVC